MAASGPVCNAAESADATHALHAAVCGLDQGASLHSADSMSRQPSPSALAQLPAAAAEAHAAATPLAISVPTTRLAPDFAAVRACQIPADGSGKSVLALCQKEQWQALLLPRPPLQ